MNRRRRRHQRKRYGIPGLPTAAPAGRWCRSARGRGSSGWLTPATIGVRLELSRDRVRQLLRVDGRTARARDRSIPMKQVALLVALVALAALPACVPSQPTPDPVTRPATRPTAVPAAPPATAPATAPVTFFGDEPVDVTTVSGPVTALDDRSVTVWPHYPAGATERPPPSAYRIEAYTRVTVPRPHPDGTSTRGVPGTRADLRVGQLVILTAEDGVARLIHIVRDPAGQPAAAPTSGPYR